MAQVERGAGSGNEPVGFDDCLCIKDTGRALLVMIHGEQVWVPQSCVHDDSEVFDDREHREGRLVLKGWFARKKGLGG